MSIGAERYKVIGGNFFLTFAVGLLLGVVLQAALGIVGPRDPAGKSGAEVRKLDPPLVPSPIP
jgi:hypothetical protein